MCNSKVDSRCADPIQLAEEDGGEDGDEGGSSSNNNNNKNKNHNNNHHSNSNNNNNNNNSNNKNPNHNNFNIDNNKNRFDEQNEGLQMVDCKVAQGVRQAMDAVSHSATSVPLQSPTYLAPPSGTDWAWSASWLKVSGLLNRLGQRAPGGGDVWAAVRASNLAAQSSQSDGVGPSGTSAGSSQSSGSSPSSTGSSGSSRPSSQYSSQGFPRQGGFSGQRGYDDHDLSAACHKVEMEGRYAVRQPTG